MPRQPARASGSRGGGSKEGAERHGSFGAFLRLGSGPSVFVLRSSGRKVGRAFRLRANAIRHLDSRADAWPDRRDIGFDDAWTNSGIRWAHWRRWLPNLRRRGWGRHPRRVRRRRGCWCCGCSGLCDPIDVLIMIFGVYPPLDIIFILSMWFTSWFAPRSRKFHLGYIEIGTVPFNAIPKVMPVCISSLTGISNFLLASTSLKVLVIAVPSYSTA